MNHPSVLSRRACMAGLASAALAPFALTSQAASRKAASAPRRWTAVERLLEALVAEGKAPGAGVGISYGGAPPAYPAAGTLAFDSPTRFDEDSICRLYSITKNVTRIASMLLIEDGKLSLDQPVSDVLPEFRSLRVAIDIEKGLDSRPAKNTMTMRHLLTHTSGLGNWTPASDSGDALHAVYRQRGITPGLHGHGRARPDYGAQVKDLNELVKRVAEIPLAYEPGTVRNYSVGFDVMGLVIERVSGQRYDDFLRERLFEPLDMSSTGFRVAAKDEARLTTLYDATQKGEMRISDAGKTSEWLSQPTLLDGGGGLASTLRDFLRYGAMLQGEGALAGVRVMKTETARLALSNLTPPGAAEPNQGAGAGSRRVLLAPLAPPGTFSAAGASGTLFWLDTGRGGNVVFLAQVMWGEPAKHPYAQRLIAAIEQDLASA